MKFLNPLLKVDSEDRDNFQIIGWWELRRFLYNLIVLICGLISLSIMSALINLKSGEDLVEPISIIGFAFLCNIGYTLGWITELYSEKSKTYGPKLFKFGMYFTIICVFIPAIFQLIYWIGRGFVKA